MTVSYLDSSGLVRFCVAEGDVSLVEVALSSAPISSAVTSVELPTAISARFHRNSITEQQRDDMLRLAGQLLGQMSLLDLNAEMLRAAVRVGSAHLVRTLDALHLGSAVVAARQQARRGNQLRFCTADRRQAEVAAALFGPAQVDLVAPLA